MMPEKIVATIAEWREVFTVLGFAVIGALLGIGRVLLAKDRPPTRIAVGRCLVNTGLAMSAGVVLLPFPTASLVAQLGVAAALASLGTSYLEKLVNRTLGLPAPGKEKS